jgi:hypothetical protein
VKHFHRTSLPLDDVIAAAEAFFPTIGLSAAGAPGPRTRSFTGPIGALTLSVKAEGGHYTFVEAHTDQMGESRLDRNVKKFFVRLHRAADPSHRLDTSY